MAAVLIVDDEHDAPDALSNYLGRFGHTVEVAAHGQAALLAILSNRPDVLVLDLLLPGMDGPSLLEVIRSYLRLQKIPVVVWTGAGETSVVDRARRLGVHAILAKPSATFPQIRAAVEEAVREVQV